MHRQIATVSIGLVLFRIIVDVSASSSRAWTSPGVEDEKFVLDQDNYRSAVVSEENHAVDHGQWLLKCTIDSTDPESWSPTGTTQMVDLSPDGLTLANGYTVIGQSFDVRGFKVNTHTYVDRLQSWIPLTDEPIRVDSAGAYDRFRMDMGLKAVVVSHIGVEFPGPGQHPTYADSDIRLWILAESHVRGKTAVFWKEVKVSLENDSVEKEKEMFGASISIYDEEDNDMSGVYGQVLLAVGIPRSEYDPNGGRGRVQVYSYVRDPVFSSGHWEKYGSSLSGDNYAFGSDVKLSIDGNTLAVLGSYRHKSEYFPLPVCLIRLFRYSMDLKEWVQMGQDVRADGHDDSLMCENMALSPDGRTVAAGSRWFSIEEENNRTVGHVRVWTWDEPANEWKRKGPDIDSIVPAMAQDQDFTFGFLLSLSENGDRLVVISYEGPLPATPPMHQRSVAYASTFDWKEEEGWWVQTDMGLPLVDIAIKDIAMDPKGRHLAIQSEDVRDRSYIDTFRWWPPEAQISVNTA